MAATFHDGNDSGNGCFHLLPKVSLVFFLIDFIFLEQQFRFTAKLSRRCSYVPCPQPCRACLSKHPLRSDAFVTTNKLTLTLSPKVYSLHVGSFLVSSIPAGFNQCILTCINLIVSHRVSQPSFVYHVVYSFIALKILCPLYSCLKSFKKENTNGAA